MDHPPISVIIPVYRPGAHLTACLDSVLAQSMSQFEVLVIDDGSPEDVSWVGELSDPRIHLVRQPNLGVSAARNHGAQISRGTWLAFLDQDDTWHPDKLARQWESLCQQPDAAFHHTGFTWVTGPDRRPGGLPDVTYRGLLKDQHVCLSSLIVRRAAYLDVGGHDITLAQMQDYDLMLRLALGRPDPVITPAHLVDYHLHDNNASRDYQVAVAERASVLRRHLAVARRRGDSLSVHAAKEGLKRGRELYAFQAFDTGRRAAHQGAYAVSAGHLARTVRLSPRTSLVIARSAGRATLGSIGRRIGRSTPS